MNLLDRLAPWPQLAGLAVWLEILEGEQFNFESAGAVLLGLDTANLISITARQPLSEILNSDDQMSELTDQMIATISSLDRNTAPQCELLIRKLRQGFFGLKA